MLNLSLFLFTYILIIFSILGYGVFFEKIFYDKSNSVSNIGYTGLIGVFFLVNIVLKKEYHFLFLLLYHML